MSGKELKKHIENSSFTMLEVIEKTGIPQRTLYNIFSKEEVEDHYVEKIRTIGIKLPNYANESKRIPYYDVDATAGNVTIFAENGPEYVKQYIDVPAFSDCQMFIGVSGNSMYPKYCSGELIALKRIDDRDVIAFNEAYLVVTKEQRLLKYIRKGSDKDHWLLASENSEFESFEVPIKKVLHLYIVKGKITKNII